MKPFLLIYRSTVVLLTICLAAASAAAEPADVAELVHKLKSDSRGPFQSIVWLCPDGTVLPASQRCAEPGGIQRGLLKDAVKELEAEGIYLGQILAGGDRAAFLDAANQYSRVRQYQIEGYLRQRDDGWIMKHARRYRGAMHAADEEAWGADFLEWLLTDDTFVAEHFFWARELARDIPHSANEERASRIRVLADRLALGMPDFLPISVKIHSLPDSTDLGAVREFQSRQSLPAAAIAILDTLQDELAKTYEVVTPSNVAARFQARIKNDGTIYRELMTLAVLPGADVAMMTTTIAELLGAVREQVFTAPTGQSRLALLDLSMTLERLLVANAEAWQPTTLGELFEKCGVLASALVGCGYIASEEWERLQSPLDMATLSGAERLEDLFARTMAARHGIYESVSALEATYGQVVVLFASFEPMAGSYINSRIETSLLRPMGETVGRLWDEVQSRAHLTHEVVNVDSTSVIRGLNAGVAVGELVVVHGRADNFAFESDKIYVLQQAPEKIKPVAGLLSVNDGDPVSQVQRLSNRLAIPNAAIQLQHVEALTEHSGRLIFCAVSPHGRVVVKSTWDMTADERQLFAAEGAASVVEYLEALDAGLSLDTTVNLGETLGERATN